MAAQCTDENIKITQSNSQSIYIVKIEITIVLSSRNDNNFKKFTNYNEFSNNIDKNMIYRDKYQKFNKFKNKFKTVSVWNYNRKARCFKIYLI